MIDYTVFIYSSDNNDLWIFITENQEKGFPKRIVELGNMPLGLSGIIFEKTYNTLDKAKTGLLKAVFNSIK